MEKMKYDVIIIGAGPAGLTAAYELLTQTANQRIVIFESSDEIGGIAKTVEYHGNRIDIGGHRFFSKNDEVMEFWKKLMPLQGKPSCDDLILKRNVLLENGGPDPETEEQVMLIRNRLSRIFYLRKFFDYPISISLQTFRNMGLIRTFYAGFSYLRAMFFKRKEDSLRDFMINRFGYALYRMFFEDYTQKVWGRNPADISADWGRQRIKGISIMKALKSAVSKKFTKYREKGEIAQKHMETSFIEQFLYPKKGPGQLWETLAKEIIRLGKEKFGPDYEAIQMKKNVVSFKIENQKIQSVVTQDGDIFSAENFISSMPLKDLVEGMNDVPEEIMAIAGGLPYRDFITVGLLLRKLEIQNETKLKTIGNIIPDTWIYVQEREVQLGRLQIFNNWSPYLVKDFQNTVWIGLEYFCTEGDHLWCMEDRKFIDFAIKEIADIGIIRPENVLDSVCIRVKKAYPAYFDTYQHFDKLRNFLDSIPNLYCIGRNGQHRYNNMDHSMLSAIEAVKILLKGEQNKRSLWNINAEQEYHEMKQKK